MHVRRKQKAFQHLRCGYIAFVGFDIGCNVRDESDKPGIFVQPLVVLREIAYLHRLAAVNPALIGLDVSHNHIQKSSLAAAVSTYDADPVVTQKHVLEILNQLPVTECFGDSVYLNDLSPQTTGYRRHFNSRVVDFQPGILKLMKTLNSSLCLRRTSLRTAPYPRKFLLIYSQTLSFCCKLHFLP